MHLFLLNVADNLTSSFALAPQIFIDQERWAELRPRSLIESVKRALADQFLDHKRLEKRIAREKKKANERGAETEQEFLERQLAGLKRVKATEEHMKQNPSDLKGVFDQFDKNKDGVMDRTELTNLLQVSSLLLLCLYLCVYLDVFVFVCLCVSTPPA